MVWVRNPRRAESEMVLLLAFLSKMAAWALLAVLGAGLLRILKPLESIRRSLERITMGVRAIEQETAPLGAHVDAVATSLTQTADTLGATARQLAAVDRDLDAAASALRPRS